MLTAKIEVIGDNLRNDIRRVTFLIYLGNIENSIGICVVEVNPNGEAEIYTIQINEPYRGKHYGSKLWRFAETYVKRKYHAKRFIGELNIGTNPAIVEFWKNQKFHIEYKETDLAFAVKEIKR